MLYVQKNTFEQNIDKLFDKWISRIMQLIQYHIFVEEKGEEEGEEGEEISPFSLFFFFFENM